MGYGDLREWLSRVETFGELRTIEGADWNLEIGAIIEMARKEARTPPCILFDSIKGYPKGYRLAAGLLNSIKRVALTTNMPLDLPPMEFVQTWRGRIREMKPVPPMYVKDAAFMENVWEGANIDLLRFPTPHYNIGDGGRYIGTGHLTITRDPDEGWVNIGTYRVMVHDAKRLGLYMSPGRHGRIQMEKEFERGRSFPVALAIGYDPLIFMASAFEVPYGLSEYDFAGGLKGEPVKVVRLDRSGLPVPADAEMVIEGECLPSERMAEGPLGEWTGYYASHVRDEPVIRVQRVCFRNDPIMTGAPPSRPPTEATFYKSFWRSAMVWEELERAGVPDVRGVWCPPEGNTRLLTVVAIRQRYPGHARQAGIIASQCHAAAYLGRFTVVVDDDIDPTDMKDVWWAMTTRCDPAEDIEILRRCWSSPLDPILPKERKDRDASCNSRAVIDACRPYEWMNEFPEAVKVPPDLAEQVRRKWGKQILV
ncbi:MAG TPA: UbiD family decarboxylase [candidate division Zixibacteria bacterium]|nr:UbiD family decarboxylase [candidate division Zixibacteria bacterium]